MGYYSYHTLFLHEIKGTDKTEEVIITEFLKEFPDAQYAINESDMAKRYDSDEQILEFSKRYPDCVFCLFREGEDDGDLSNTYFKNGKFQLCGAIIAYDDYDESKLQ